MMKYKSIVTSAFLTIPFFVVSSISAEIFELVIDYDITANDIEAADFNNDGLEDFAITEWIVDSSDFEVFLSNGDCSFTRLGPVYVDSSFIGQLLTGDFNEDSNEDLLLMSVDETWLYSGDGSGNFILDEVFPWSYLNGCIGDIDNDGHLDLVGVNSEENSVAVMLGDGAAGFTEGWVYNEDPPYISSRLAYFVDPDTTLDLCVPCGVGFLIFEGIGDGGFSNPNYYEVDICPGGVAYQDICTYGDFNEDGYNDIAFTGLASMSAYSTFVFLNQQDGTFEQFGGYFTGACSVEGIATADLDLDGYLDLAMFDPLGGSLAGYGDGGFNIYAPLSGLPGSNSIFIDMDQDGDLDLADRLGNIFMNTTINLGIEGESEGFITNIVLNVSPNPFSGFVNVEVSGYPDGSGNLQIFDLSGRLIAELEAVSTEGEAVFHWNGVSSAGVELPSGIYTARLCSGNTIANTVLLKLE